MKRDSVLLVEGRDVWYVCWE